VTEPVRPNFLIAGAARSGTTSLYRWLSQHPDVFMSENKEPSFFVDTYGFSDWNAYLALFERGRGKKAVGEASTPYMSAPESAAWIRRVLGDVKIIILLRNPIERAWSLYSWMVMEGYEWLPTLERALAEEEGRFSDAAFYRRNPQYFWNYMYFRSGLYHDRVLDYFAQFGRDLVRLYLFDDLVNSPRAVYADVCKFLDLDAAFEPSLIAENASNVPRSIGLQYRLRRLWRTASARPDGRPGLTRSLIGALMAANVRRGRRARMDTITYDALKTRYAAEVRRLSRLIDRHCHHWIA
jgi:hypothetical protein